MRLWISESKGTQFVRIAQKKWSPREVLGEAISAAAVDEIEAPNPSTTLRPVPLNSINI